MTEQEARTKWCPMVRHGGGEDFAANRWEMGANPQPEWGTETNPSSCRCIASDCMMWVPERRYKEGSIFCVVGGYCGLARKV